MPKQSRLTILKYIKPTHHIYSVVQKTIMSAQNITLYTAATPNGFKISIMLEELGLSYHTQPVDLMINEQKEEYAHYILSSYL